MRPKRSFREISLWAGVVFTLVSAVSMLATWGLAEYDVRTASGIFGLLTAATFFLGLGGLGIAAGSLALDWLRRPPEPTPVPAEPDHAGFWKDVVQLVPKLFSSVLLVVGLVQTIPRAWDLVSASWEQIPRKYRQAAPVCKYVRIAPLRKDAPGAHDALQVRFDDDAAIAAHGPLTRPVVLALKGVENGPHRLQVHATIGGREWSAAASVKIFDFADFYFFEVPDGAATGDVQPSVGLIQWSIVRDELARAGLTLPACATLASGPSIPALD